MSRSRRGSPCPSPSVNSVSGVLLGKLTRAEPILHGRLPPIRSPTPLLHTHSLQIESLNPQNFGRRDARRKLWAAPNRLEALGTVSGIMNDIGYYRHFMQEEEPETSPVPERVQARRYSEEDAEEKFDWTQKLAEGWTYERSHKAKGAGPTAGRYKHALNAKDGGLSWCELKAAELSSSGGAVDPMHTKASIWLMNDRNFQKYDTRGIGVIDEPDLVEAMKVFLHTHWKYDGTLW